MNIHSWSKIPCTVNTPNLAYPANVYEQVLFATGRKQDSGDEYEQPCVVYNNIPPVKDSHEYEEGISTLT